MSVALARPARRPVVSARFLAQRLLTGVLAVLGACALVFFALYASGNPARTLLPPESTQAEIEAFTTAYGFDRPLAEQFATFVGRALSGDLPDSFRYHENPYALALAHVPQSLAIGVPALLIGALAGGAIGYAAATGSAPWRRALLSAAIGANALPTFFTAVLLVWLFAVILRVLPASGAGTPAHAILPIVTLALAVVPDVARVFRSSVIEVERSDHVRGALARGVSPRRLAGRHVIPNALGPTVHLLASQAGYVLGGAVIVEAAFAWPGLGQLSMSALAYRDYPLVIACVLVIAVGFVVASLLADIVSSFLEPRLRR